MPYSQPLLTPFDLTQLDSCAREMLGDAIDGAYCFSLPLRKRFRRITVREGVLVHGPYGWGEISPFWDYGPRESFQWAYAGIEAACTKPPQLLSDRVAVNVTVPVTDPATARAIVASAHGCTTAKVKVADPGVDLDADEARIAAVREAFDDLGIHNAAIRIDANAAWDVSTAATAIKRLDAAARGSAGIGLQYAEQPCPSVDELAQLRQIVDVPIAADESIRRGRHPYSVISKKAADYLVVKVHPCGGISRLMEFLDGLSLPVVVSSAVDSSIGLHRGAVLAAALSDCPPACGLGTGLMFDRDIATERVLPRNGAISVAPVDVDESLAAPAKGDLVWRWRHRLNAIGSYSRDFVREDGGYAPDAFRVSFARAPQAAHTPQAAHAPMETHAPKESEGDESCATLSARATVMSLIAAGVRDIVICPGSRNAPLTYAAKHAADAGLVRLHVRIDERSAAFFALGLSKAGRAHIDGRQERALSGCVPVALMMTSGTAVMNMHPAIAEASHSWVPLIVVSADRPASLRGTAANQTADQVNVFGSQTRFYADIPSRLPASLRRREASEYGAWLEAMTHLVGTGLRYAQGFEGKDPGPMQLNVQYEAPLVENSNWRPSPIDLAEASQLLSTLGEPRSADCGSPAAWAGSLCRFPERGPWSRQAGVERARGRSAAITPSLAEAINPALTTVVVACEPGAPNRRAARTVLDLAQRANWLVCAEPSSGIRAGSTTPCDYQAGLRQLAAVAPSAFNSSADDPLTVDGIEQVIVLGHPTLSRPIARLVESPHVRQIRISPWGTICDTGHVAHAIVTDLPDAAQVDAIVSAVDALKAAGSTVAERQQRINDIVVEASRPSEHFMFFGQAVRAIWDRHIEQDSRIPLVIGSSNAIRIVDRCAVPTPSVDTLPFVLTNRGLAGIDGTIACALGVATGLGCPVRAVMGDITFFHDCSSLLQGALEDTPDVQIVVLNDNGGAIFRDLEHGQPNRRHAFDRFFRTPQKASLSQIAAGFGASYRRVATLEEMNDCLNAPLQGGISIVEVLPS